MVQVLSQITDRRLLQKLPVFATEEFLGAKSSQYGWLTSEDYLLPYFIDSRLSFKRLVFTTETISLSDRHDSTAEIEFLDDVVELCRKGKPIGVDFIATAQANAVFNAVPSESEHLEWGSYTVDLKQPEGAIFNAFHSKHRNVIRKASASGVVISTTNDTALVYHCVRETMERQKLLFFPSHAYLSELQRRLRGMVTFYTAMREARLQGVAVVVHNHLGAFYYYGGSTENPFTGSLNFLQSEIIKDLKSKNVPVYDLMGARIVKDGDLKIEGIQKFKSRFASGMRKGYCFKKVFNPLRYRLFVCAVKAYFALRGSRYAGDVIDQARQSQLVPAAEISPEQHAPSSTPTATNCTQ